MKLTQQYSNNVHRDHSPIVSVAFIFFIKFIFKLRNVAVIIWKKIFFNFLKSTQTSRNSGMTQTSINFEKKSLSLWAF